MKKFLASLFFVTSLCAHKADFVIFSYDRPLQLKALLQTAEQHVSGVGQTVVLYRASASDYERAYEEVAGRFSSAIFIQQPHKYAHETFKPLLMKVLRKYCRNPHLLFAVDDIVIKDKIDLTECISLLEKHQAEGFHLRLGKNLDYCYANQADQPLPPFEKIGRGALRWCFKNGKHDWHYPHTVDCTVYRKKQILKEFSEMSFINPNNLEGRWASRFYANFSRYGLCYKQSKVVNLPMNLVNETERKNPVTNSYTPQALLKMFQQGKEMDTGKLFQIDNRSAHIDYEPVFI